MLRLYRHPEETIELPLTLLQQARTGRMAGQPVFRRDASSTRRRPSVARRRVTLRLSGSGACRDREALGFWTGYARHQTPWRKVCGRVVAPETDTAKGICGRSARSIRV